MISKHPIATRTPTSSVADVEAAGKTWQSMSTEYLVGYTTEFGGTDAGSQTPAVIEMQRRLKHSIDRFSTASTWLALAMIFLAVVSVVVAAWR